MATGQDALCKHVICAGGRYGYVDDGDTPNSEWCYFDYEPAPVIFEMRNLPKDKSLLGKAWGDEAMDSYRGLRKGFVVQCEGGHVSQSTAYDKSGKVIRTFRGTGGGGGEHGSFIRGIRSRKTTDLAGDMLQGHLSAGLIHMADIALKLGKPSPAAEVRERIGGRKELQDAYDSFREHLARLGVNVDKTVVTGAMLTLDPKTERFTGDLSEEANKLLTREYREPFVVPETV